MKSALWMLLLAVITCVWARPASESIEFREHPFPSLDKYFRLPIHPLAQNTTFMDDLQQRYDWHREINVHQDLVEFSQERRAWQRKMQTRFGRGGLDYKDYWRNATNCNVANNAIFSTEHVAEPRDLLGSLYGLVHGNCRYSREVTAIQYFRDIHKGKYNFQRAVPRTDPSKYLRCVMAMDDDGLCGSVTDTDDDDDDQQDPCADDDDGIPSETSEHPFRYEGPSFVEGNGRCCSPTSNNGKRCGNTNLSFDDDQWDWDDEEVNFHRTAYGNECDDDDADDDDAKNTFSYVDNTLGSSRVADFYRVQQQMRNAHESIEEAVSFVNQVWLCSYNPTVDVPFSLAASIPIMTTNETAIPGSNITNYQLKNNNVAFVYNDTIAVQPCGIENNTTATYNFVAEVNTTMLVTAEVYDNLTMTLVNVTQPVNVTIVVPVELQVTATIPDPAQYPQVDLASSVLQLGDFNLVNDSNLIAQHVADNWNNPELTSLVGTFNQYPFPVIGYTGGGRTFRINGLLPMLDLIRFGPYYFSSDTVDGACKTCSRMCEVLTFQQRLQVIRARNATRFFASPALHHEREARLLNSHTTFHGDLLCELKDMMDWLRCFSRTVQYPQLERVISCLEIFYFGAQNSEHSMPFVNIDTLIEYGTDYIREIEVWYAERGYYTQRTIENGCIDPEIVEWSNRCMPQDLRARILNEQPRFDTDDQGNRTSPYEREYQGMCLFDSQRSVSSRHTDYSTGSALRYDRSIEYPRVKCMPSQGNPRERQIADCRSSAMAQIMQKFTDAMSAARSLSISMQRRVALLAEHLRIAREDHPDDYVFPQGANKCFAQSGTAFAHITPTGNITLALQTLMQDMPITPLQLTPIPN